MRTPRGHQDPRDRGHRPRSVRRHDAGRHGRRRHPRRPRRSASRAATRPTPPADVLNRGRRSIGVDLKNPDGVETLLALVEQADALIEGFRPGVAERLGIGPDVCLARNPRLVYGRMTGLGPGRSRTRRRPATTSTTSRSPARSSRIGRAGRAARAAAQPRRRLRRRRHAARLRRGVRRCSRRRRSGKGQVVDAAMVDGAAVPDDDVPRVPRHGHLGATSGARTCSTPAPTSTTCTRRADGKYVSIGSIEPQFYAELLAPHRPRRRRDAAHGSMDRAAVARAEGAVRGDLQDEDPRRVVRDHGGHRRLLRAGALAGRGARSTRTTSSARRSSSATASCSPRRRPRFSRTPGRDPAPAVARRPAHRRGPRRLGPRRRDHRQAARRRGQVASRRRQLAGASGRAGSLPGMATLVCFHAHPDDESHRAPAGPWPRPRPPATASCSSSPPAASRASRARRARPRARQLAAAAGRRSCTARPRSSASQRVEFLGYVDSGMMGEPENDEPGCFWQADVDEAAERLAAILREEDADVLTIYDDHGGYGHPDHIQVHRVGGRAAELAGRRRTSFEATMNRDPSSGGIRERLATGRGAGRGASARRRRGHRLRQARGDRSPTRSTSRDFVDHKRECDAGPRQPDRRHRLLPGDARGGLRARLRHRVVHRATARRARRMRRSATTCSPRSTADGVRRPRRRPSSTAIRTLDDPAD